MDEFLARGLLLGGGWIESNPSPRTHPRFSHDTSCELPFVHRSQLLATYKNLFVAILRPATYHLKV